MNACDIRRTGTVSSSRQCCTRLLLYFALALAGIVSSVFQEIAASTVVVLPLLTNAAQVRGLSPYEAERGYPVRLRAMVMFIKEDPDPLCFVQDSSGALFVSRTRTNSSAIHAGERSEERRVGKECRYRWSRY